MLLARLGECAFYPIYQYFITSVGLMFPRLDQGVIHSIVYGWFSLYLTDEPLPSSIIDMSNLKLKSSQYPAIHTNHMLHHCIPLKYNQNI